MVTPALGILDLCVTFFQDEEKLRDEMVHELRRRIQVAHHINT